MVYQTFDERWWKISGVEGAHTERLQKFFRHKLFCNALMCNAIVLFLNSSIDVLCLDLLLGVFYGSRWTNTGGNQSSSGRERDGC